MSPHTLSCPLTPPISHLPTLSLTLMPHHTSSAPSYLPPHISSYPLTLLVPSHILSHLLMPLHTSPHYLVSSHTSPYPSHLTLPEIPSHHLTPPHLSLQLPAPLHASLHLPTPFHTPSHLSTSPPTSSDHLTPLCPPPTSGVCVSACEFLEVRDQLFLIFSSRVQIPRTTLPTWSAPRQSEPKNGTSFHPASNVPQLGHLGSSVG